MKVPLLLLAAALGCSLLLFFTGAGRHSMRINAAVAASTSSPGDVQAADLVLQRCGACHSLNRLARHPQNRAGWTNTVHLMEQMGAQVSPDEEPVILNYLVRHYPPKQP